MISRTFSQAAGYLSLAALLVSLRWVWLLTPTKDSAAAAPSTTAVSKDPFASIRHANATCQVTPIFPFQVGCPNKCQRAISADEPMYRMALVWYFGKVNQTKGYTYEKGHNYECPDEFVDNFRTASRTMETILPKKVPGLQFKPQEYIHMSLAYLCCLRKNETNWAREVMYEWVLENHPFKFDVTFDNIECWRERHNSVTNIINVDAASQRHMLQMNLDLEQKLRDRGIPTEVPRTMQMPFHATLFGVYRGDKNSVAQEDDVGGDVDEIYKHVHQLSQTYGRTWAGHKPMTIQHAPHFTAVGKLHAGKE